MKTIISILFVVCVSQAANLHRVKRQFIQQELPQQEQQQKYPPQPYEFSFLVNDPSEGLIHRREEQGHEDGSKTGTVQYRDPYGRIVTETYVANKQGYFPSRSVSDPIDIPQTRDGKPVALLKLPGLPEIDLTIPHSNPVV